MIRSTWRPVAFSSRCGRCRLRRHLELAPTPSNVIYIGNLPQSYVARVPLDDSPLVGLDGSARVEASAITLVEPNPSPRGVHVRYAVARGGPVRLEVLDVAGRVVATLADGARAAAPGLYFERYTAAERVSVRKFVTLRWRTLQAGDDAGEASASPRAAL